MRQHLRKCGWDYRRALPTALAVLAVAATALPAVAASVTGQIHWDQPTGINVQPGSFGLNLFQGFNPNIAGTPGNTTYKNNVAAMHPGIVRYHQWGMINDSTTDPNGWVTSPNTTSPGWDATKINNAMSGSYSFNPIKMMNIPRWPAGLCVSSSDSHLQASQYTTFANWCASLVRIVNINQGRAVKYWEITNEQDDLYATNCDELGRIFNQAAAAMKAVDPTIKVGGPAFARPDLTARVDAFYSTAAPNLDFVSYHTYASGSTTDTNQSIWNTAASWGWATNNMRTEYAKYSTRSIEYYHDEFNISWNPPDGRMNNEIGMIFDALAMTAMINANATGTMAWNEADGWYGKLDGAWNMRPSALLYQVLNTDGGGAVSGTSTSDASKVVLLGTKAGSWVHLLLINRSEAAQTIQLTVTGLPAGANSSTSFTTKQVGNWGSITYGSATLGTLTSATGYSLPTNSITMLVLDTSTIGGGTPPAAPTGLTATAGNAQVALSWTASSGATSYNVKRSTTSGSGYATVSSPTSTSYTNTGLTNGTTYYYVVTAVNSAGESGNSGQASAAPDWAVITGTKFGDANGPWGGNQSNTYDKAYDGNTGTFYDCAAATGGYTGIDFGASTTGTVKAIRFWPRSGFASRMVGGVFEGANSQTTGYVTLYTISTAPADGAWTRVTIAGAAAYRYLRYRGPSNGYCNVAEVEFRGTTSSSSNPNLIQNPGFESGLTSWGTGSGVIVANAHTGSRAFQMATGNSGHGSQTITGWVAGATYTFSAWEIQTGSGGVTLDYWVGGTKTNNWLPDGGSTYTFKSMNVTLPAGTTAVSVGFWNNWGTQTYDDFSLVKQ